MDTPQPISTTRDVAAKRLNKPDLPIWLSALIPLILLAALVAIFFFTNPLAIFKTGGLPPIESLSIERVELLPGQFVVTVFNGSPGPLTIAQVAVDDAFWEWEIKPAGGIFPFCCGAL